MHLVLKWILLLAVILGILVAILVDILSIISINVNIPNYKGETEHRFKRSKLRLLYQHFTVVYLFFCTKSTDRAARCNDARFILYRFIGTPMDDGEQRICSSNAYFNQSMTILSVMNLSVDPCNDFYQHACGNWNYRDEIKIDQLRDENRFNIQKILGETG